MTLPRTEYEVVSAAGVTVASFSDADLARAFIRRRAAEKVTGLTLYETTHHAPTRRRLRGPAAHIRAVA